MGVRLRRNPKRICSSCQELKSHYSHKLCYLCYRKLQCRWLDDVDDWAIYTLEKPQCQGLMYKMGFCKKHWKSIRQSEKERRNRERNQGKFRRNNPPRKLKKSKGRHPIHEGETAWLWHQHGHSDRFYVDKGVRGYNVHDRKNDDYAMVAILRDAAEWIEQSIENDPHPWYDKAAAMRLINNPDVAAHEDTKIVDELLITMRRYQSRADFYHGAAQLVLQHGQYFTNITPDPQLGPVQLCFANSQKLILESSLLYVEGYVLTSYGMIIPHGWNITPDGEVIDTTLRGGGKEYFGFVFNSEFVIKRTGIIGPGTLLHDHETQLTYNQILEASQVGWNHLRPPENRLWARLVGPY